jgi:CHAT domain-containing protein
MSEIHDLNLNGCELAILSACQTNFGPEQRGEGVWTLSRGFLVAGSRRVIASNWVVDDAAGATLVSYFVRQITSPGQDASSRDYAEALHEAKKQLRMNEKWAHPFYWSSLVLVGPK